MVLVPRALFWPFGSESQFLPDIGMVKRTYLGRFGTLEVGQRIRSLQVFRVLKKLRVDRVLDVGCGAGSYSFALRRRGVASEVLAVDVNGDQIRLAKLIQSRAGISGIEFRCVDIGLGPIRGSRLADLALCVDVLGYFQDDLSALKNIRESLHRHGLLLLHVPLAQPRRVFRAFETITSGAQLYTRDWYDISSLRQLLSAGGFEIEREVLTYGFAAELAYELSANSPPLIPKWMRVMLLPMFLLLIRLDLLSKHRGNGVLILARAASNPC